MPKFEQVEAESVTPNDDGSVKVVFPPTKDRESFIINFTDLSREQDDTLNSHFFLHEPQA